MTTARRWKARTLLIAVVAISAAGPAAAEEVPFVDGHMWQKSAKPLKLAYLVGISNLLSAEYAFQQSEGFPPDSQSSIRTVYDSIDDLTLDQTINRINRWYARNQDKLKTTVLEVIWTSMVERNVQ